LEKLKNYRPSEKEPFMNDRQRDYFRAKLLAWKDEILRESRITLQTLQEENVNHPDLADRASSETDRAIELRARDRQRKLISKIVRSRRSRWKPRSVTRSARRFIGTSRVGPQVAVFLLSSAFSGEVIRLRVRTAYNK
jgi:hypothetical protein